MFTFFTMLIMV